MAKNKYQISNNYLLQLENDELRERIKALKTKVRELENKLLGSPDSQENEEESTNQCRDRATSAIYI
jgi:regulator of replication initiation timing